LAVPGAVRQRRIEKRDPLIHGCAQRLPRLAVAPTAPLPAAQAPGAEAQLADGVTGAAEGSSVHGRGKLMAVRRYDGMAVETTQGGFTPGPLAALGAGLPRGFRAPTPRLSSPF